MITKRMIVVDVKQTHIDTGKPMGIYNCALALAISEAVEQPCVVSAYGVRVRNQDIESILPKIALDFRRNFDNGQPVEPISFELDDAFLGEKDRCLSLLTMPYLLEEEITK